MTTDERPDELTRALDLLERAYVAWAKREWEVGPTLDEVMEDVMHCCNNHDRHPERRHDD